MKRNKVFDYILFCLVLGYFLIFIVTAVLDLSGVIYEGDIPYMLKKVIELGPAFVLAFFVNEAIQSNRVLSKKIANLEKNGISNVFPNGVTADLDDPDFFKCQEIRICCVVGGGFLKYHEKRILEALKYGTRIRILFAKKTLEDGSENPFIRQNNNMLLEKSYEGKVEEGKSQKDLFKEIDSVVSIINSINEKADGHGCIEYAQYETEYRDKYVLRYSNEKGEKKISGWFNMTVPIRGPQDSILFSGSVLEEERNKYVENDRNKKIGNIIFDLELHFDCLWEKYAKQ